MPCLKRAFQISLSVKFKIRRDLSSSHIYWEFLNPKSWTVSCQAISCDIFTFMPHLFRLISRTYSEHYHVSKNFKFLSLKTYVWIQPHLYFNVTIEGKWQCYAHNKIKNLIQFPHCNYTALHFNSNNWYVSYQYLI